jgi:hypothetical protein
MNDSAAQPGFMGALPPSQSLDAVLRPPSRDDKLFDWAYELPPEVMDTVSFTGTRADLHYAIKEPTLDQLRSMMVKDGRPIDMVSDYVRAIGRADENGNPIKGEDGQVELMPVGHAQASQWLARVGTIAFGLVTNEWTKCFAPTPAAGEALRGSRRRG